MGRGHHPERSSSQSPSRLAADLGTASGTRTVNADPFTLMARETGGGGGTGRDLPLRAPLTLARKPCFATFAGVGGWLVRPPWRFPTKRRRASRKRPADCSRRVLAIDGIIFDPRSIFDPVMAGQRSNFRKFHDFSTSPVDSMKTIYRIDLHQRVPRSIMHRMLCFDAHQLNI